MPSRHCSGDTAGNRPRYRRLSDRSDGRRRSAALEAALPCVGPRWRWTCGSGAARRRPSHGPASRLGAAPDPDPPCARCHEGGGTAHPLSSCPPCGLCPARGKDSSIVSYPRQSRGYREREPLNPVERPSVTHHPKYWSRSEISGDSRRAIRGECAAASRPTSCFPRAETAARRAKRDVDLSLHLP